MADSRKDEELMRYLDGDLSPAEARQLERELAEGGDLDLQTMSGSLDQLRDTLRAHYEAKADEVAPQLGSMWARLEKQLDRAPARRSFWQGVREWFDAYRGHVLTGAVCAAAGALIAVLAVKQNAQHGGAKPQQMIQAAARGAEVESLDVTDGSGTIFEVPGDRGPTTVIWVERNDTGSGTEGPI